MRRLPRVFVDRQNAEVDGHPGADGRRHRDQHGCADENRGLPTGKARNGGRKTENSAHVETYRRGTGPTAKQNTNNTVILYKTRQILNFYRAILSRGYGGGGERGNSPPPP